MVGERSPVGRAGDEDHRRAIEPLVRLLVMVLEIVVTPECFGCDEASRLAALMRREFPVLEVELHILTGTGQVPPGVVATPTYLLDGRPIFLGNPRPAALVAEVASRLRTTA